MKTLEPLYSIFCTSAYALSAATVPLVDDLFQVVVSASPVRRTALAQRPEFFVNQEVSRGSGVGVEFVQEQLQSEPAKKAESSPETMLLLRLKSLRTSIR